MQPTSRVSMDVEQFEIRRLADGVYAALGTTGAATFSNAGIVDLGDQTLIFDTFELPRAGQELRHAAECLTGRPASYVVISHSHSDHWGGNQSFDSRTPVLAARGCRNNMADDTRWMEELRENPSELESAIQDARLALDSEPDPLLRNQLERSIARMSGLMAELPVLELRLPDVIFEGSLSFHGTDRTVELHTVTPAHTASDSYLLLPDEHIMFMGDLGFFESQPFMVFCDPQAWQAWLEQQVTTEIEFFVPGHGPVGTRDDLALQRRYIAEVMDMVERVVGRGGTVQDALAHTLPEPFGEWARTGRARWEANVHAIFERLSGQQTATD